MFFLPYETRSDPLLPPDLWLRRVIRSILLAATVVAASLLAGILGYHNLGGLSWVDALLEASMILGGMGPVATMTNSAVKIFASIYALYSGLVILGLMGILLGPWVHRMMHRFHIETDGDKKKAAKGKTAKS